MMRVNFPPAVDEEDAAALSASHAWAKCQRGQRVLDNKSSAQTTAWKKSQVVYLDPMNWYVAKP
ncbi:MAG: hypothetical protein K0Q80_1365 [Microvirga sp.]|nr:hypothetical protein [Microvirga sp.]